ncbi:hypothetical protein J4H24_15455 [Vibrio alginolyticus]|uniref:hypothetical protein n=1 Tax=Vibrio alginolyticus TaxID=663 RepID=UPI001BD1E920|nr:hypothetical protein [Vibrio alginolyticus]EGQ9099369.1 hypothetical protein [Vibrio alginolyticus]MBT0029766.1 hypothetical protein [Vibrio alginolyticus]MBT0053661.1 hypothetical protein [Vibrio alginolyticus]
MDIEKYSPAVEPAEDKIHRLIRSIIGLAPIGSGTALEVFNSIWQDPVQSRIEAWMHDITMSLIELQARDESIIESLKSNDEFLSIFASANQIILRTHQQEKREYLRNAVINSLVNNDVSYDVKHTFMHLVDRMTPSHVVTLKALSDGIIWGAANAPTEARYPYFASKLLIKSLPEFQGNHLFLQHILTELSDSQFIHDIKLLKQPGKDVVQMGSHHNTDSGIIGLEIPVSELTEYEHNYQTRMTVLGFEFLDFITEQWKQA